MPEIESRSAWSGKFMIGVGWAVLDARLGDNRSHSHIADQITIGIDGPLEVLASQPLMVNQGVAVHIPAQFKHALGPVGRCTRSVYFDPWFTNQRIPSAFNEPALLSKQAAAALVGIDGWISAERWARRYIRTSDQELDKRVVRALTRPDICTSAKAMAELTGLSPSRLRELCRRDYGAPPSKLIQWLQLRATAKALPTTQSLADIAAVGGFSDQAHFTRRLVEWFGVTPLLGLSDMEVDINV